MMTMTTIGDEGNANLQYLKTRNVCINLH